MKKKRDNAYLKKRLAKEFPDVFADFDAGRIKSVRAAAAKARLIHLPTRLDALKREWKKANRAEQREFILWAKAREAEARGAHPVRPIADAAGRLLPDVRKFLSDWVKANRSKPGRIMKMIGFKRFDPTLSQAIYGGHILRPEVIPNLTSWLTKEGFR
jgi:hypothetical protein